MSELKAVETQGAASPLNTLEQSLTRVAVLRHGPDGWRCYEAFHMLRRAHWDADKAAAAEWTSAYGNKLSPEEAKRYFNITTDMEFAA